MLYIYNMGVFFSTPEDPVEEKRKILKYLLVGDPKVSVCPREAMDPAIDFMYSVTKTRIVNKGEKCPKGTAPYNQRGDMIECSAGGINDATARARR